MKPVATYQKLRGGYYTPPAIAHFLAEWAIQSPGDVVLEPSCGDGEILHAAATRLLRLGAEPHAVKDRLYGVELDALESAKASERLDSLLGIGSPIHSGDFFSFCKSHLNDRREYDAIIGNPPFIRYQSFPEEYRRIAFYLMQRAGLHPNRLTNAWVPFLVASTLLLNDDGRLAMVIPAELLQVNYAAELRYFLSRYYGKITLITFRKLLFGGIQQEVVLFLGERAGGDHSGIRTIELDNMDDLKAHELTRSVQPRVKEMDHSTEKWTMYFLDENELALVRRLRCDDRLIPSSYVMNVDVGIVTGMNEFFVLTEDQVRAFQLSPYVLPLVGRSAHLPGAIFSESDWEHNRASGAPTYMLSIPDVPSHALPREVQEYVTQGEQKGFQTGYKCRIRKHWYT
ncbi:MAG: Eco57I restriction-modification methylase domain-containing protein, partial [Ktedonobacterales bacterium]